jgi:hypothetical protein
MTSDAISRMLESCILCFSQCIDLKSIEKYPPAYTSRLVCFSQSVLLWIALTFSSADHCELLCGKTRSDLRYIRQPAVRKSPNWALLDVVWSRKCSGLSWVPSAVDNRILWQACLEQLHSSATPVPDRHQCLETLLKFIVSHKIIDPSMEFDPFALLPLSQVCTRIQSSYSNLSLET